MKNLFNSVLLKKPKRNTFNLTHDVKFTGQMGNLIPCCIMECVPGDSVKIAADSLVRFAPLISPVMHRMDATIHYFFVPNRLVFPEWENFITQNEKVAPPFFNINSSNIQDTDEGRSRARFLDYMGIEPPPVPFATNPVAINPIPLAAYQLIYNEYYRDQNLIEEVDYKLQPGGNTGNTTLVNSLMTLRRRAWRHDYFTAALPWAQKGDEIDIPLGDIYYNGEIDPQNPPNFKNDEGNSPAGTLEQGAGLIPGDPVKIRLAEEDTMLAYDPAGTLSAGSTTINNLRRAIKLQEFLERNARGGTRYIEHILAHFGVKSSDSRLQRPEYITGVKTPIIISEVLNTTGQMIDETTPGLPQGNMAGHGVSVGEGRVGSYYAEEHGYIIGIMSICPQPAYMQGIPRHYQVREPLDYYYPTFAHIGEQEIYQSELKGYTSTPREVFGYIPRYAEYKYLQNRVAGDFRTSLSYWHLARSFENDPQLSQEFIEIDPADCNRIFAVTDETVDNLYIHLVNKITASRLMPVFGTPML